MNNQTAIQPTSEQIALCAYSIWEKEGRPQGQHETHWSQAERQLKLDCTQDAGVRRRPNPAASAEPPVTKLLPAKHHNNSNRRKIMAA
jgi:hypothetical protein